MANEKKRKPLAMPTDKQVVRVINARAKDGYRRGGQKHPRGQTDWPHDTFNEVQLVALDADPFLSVSVIAASKADEG